MSSGAPQHAGQHPRGPAGGGRGGRRGGGHAGYNPGQGQAQGQPGGFPQMMGGRPAGMPGGSPMTGPVHMGNRAPYYAPYMYTPGYYYPPQGAANGTGDGSDAGSLPSTSPGVSPSFGPAQAYMNYAPRGAPYQMYPPQPGYGYQQPPAPATQQAPVPPPAKKVLTIIDPKTGEAVVIAPDNKKTAAPAPATAEAAKPAPAQTEAPAAEPAKPAAAASKGPLEIRDPKTGELVSLKKSTPAAESKPASTEKAAAPTAEPKAAEPAPAAEEPAPEQPDAEAADRQRKEAAAKAQLEEQQRLAEEKKKQLADEEAAGRAQKEADARRKADELEAKKRQLEEERRAENERSLKAIEAARAAAGNRSSAFGGAGGSGGGATGGASRGSGSFRSGAFGGPPSAGPLGGPNALPNPNDKPFDGSETNKITYSVERLLEFKLVCKQKPDQLGDVQFKVVPVRPAPGGGRPGGSFGGVINAPPPGTGPVRGSGPNDKWVRNAARPGAPAPGAAVGLVVEPIKRSENAWKPRANVTGLEATIKAVNGILNKLTLENFDRMSKQMLELPMTSVEMLKETMAAVFDKALSEPKFGEIYADLCRIIVENKGKGETWPFVDVIEKDGKFFWTTTADESVEDAKRLVGPFNTEAEARQNGERATDFKRILLNKCQEEFEKEAQIAQAEEEVKKKQEELNVAINAATKDESKIAQIKSDVRELKYDALKIKRKVLGNVQFIGELYKKKILTEKVMHSCIVKILYPDGGESNTMPGEEDLECLVKLLTTIGSTLESSNNSQTREYLNGYFRSLRQIGDNKAIPARHRFMVKDLIELRHNKWHARREELKVKTIAEVHSDAKREEMEKNSRPAGGMGGGGRSRGGPPPRNNQPPPRRPAPGQGAAGSQWTRVGGNNAPASQRKVGMVVGGGTQMSAGYKLGNSGKVAGPGAGFHRPQGGAAAANASASTAATAGAGIRASSMRPGAKGASGISGGGISGGLRPGGANRGTGLARPNMLSQQGGRLGGPARAAGGFANRMNSGPNVPPPAPQRKVPSIDTEKMENLIQNTFVEYVEMQMSSELIESIKELFEKADEDEAKSTIIKVACTMMLEKKDAERRYVPDALVELYKEKFLTTADFEQALDERLEFLGDELMDNPLAFKHYGALFAKLISDGVLEVSSLVACLSKFSAETPHLLPKFLGEVMKALKETEDGVKAVKDQNVDLKALLGEGADDDKVKKFVEDNELGDLF